MAEMNWSKLMSTKRTRGDELSNGTEHCSEVRSPYVKDHDKITFSSAFRRLKDKTQVHSFPHSDYFRNRLTHSLEVSAVGRSLGLAVARWLSQSKPKEVVGCDRADFGNVVAAACLAHDIGNPPFGHAGEEAIRHWFFTEKANRENFISHSDLSIEQVNDLVMFDGNAQGFRLLTRQQAWRNEGGMRLTCATLGAFQKYPKSSTHKIKTPACNVPNKKFGYFQDDKATFSMVAEELGLLPRVDCNDEWCRHPLAYLVEAADDICNRIADLEDGYKYGKIEYDTIKSLLETIGSTGWDKTASPPDQERCDSSDIIAYLRGRAIGALVMQTVEVFKDKYTNIMDGTFNGSLMDEVASKDEVKKLLKLCEENLFKDRYVLEAELAGFEVIHRLLEIFTTALRNHETSGVAGSNLVFRDKNVVELLKQSTQELPVDRYRGLLCVIDYVSGMTDRFAVDLYRRLSGITVGRSSY